MPHAAPEREAASPSANPHAATLPAAVAVHAQPHRRIVVGLSGGVDSAVTAWLLAREGHEVVGVFMKNWEDDDRPAEAGATAGLGSGIGIGIGIGIEDRQDEDAREYCSSRIDFVDAAAVADVIGIEIEHVNFAAEYKDRVFAAFLREHEAGRTPNPDVLCNAEIKFKSFLDHAMRLGAEEIATGHYARVRFDPGTQRHQLLKGLDPAKDQSYFLHRLTQAQLARTRFPLGALHKSEVRRLAQEIGLPNALKKDSTGICFIGERPFREFLQRYLANRPGPIEDERGRRLGEHVGLSFYTLGQRKGLGIGGLKAGRAARGGDEHAPWFVAHKDLARNTLVVVQGHGHAALQSGWLAADDASWVAGAPPMPGRHAAKTRYRQADAACALGEAGLPRWGGLELNDDEPGQAGDALSRGRFALRFDDPQWAVTPGQSAVLYDGDVCLGGGVIDLVR